MFGLFRDKSQPTGPVEIALEMRIDRTPAEVYRHLDWSDPKHAYRERGETVETVDAERGFYRLKVAQLPGHDFDFAVLEAVPYKRYSYIGETTPQIGNLVSTQSIYELQPLEGGRSCLVQVRSHVQFVDGLSEKQFHEELSRMSLACHNSLAKLKIHAEFGPEAVKNAQMAHVERVRVEG